MSTKKIIKSLLFILGLIFLMFVLIISVNPDEYDTSPLGVDLLIQVIESEFIEVYYPRKPLIFNNNFYITSEDGERKYINIKVNKQIGRFTLDLDAYPTCGDTACDPKMSRKASIDVYENNKLIKKTESKYDFIIESNGKDYQEYLIKAKWKKFKRERIVVVTWLSPQDFEELKNNIN